MIRNLVAAVTILSLCGCLPNLSGYATVDDLHAQGSFLGDYCVTEIDGEPVGRVDDFGSIHTVVPYAVVKPGEHTLSVEMPENDTRRTVKATFEAGHRYGIKCESGELSVVRRPDEN